MTEQFTMQDAVRRAGHIFFGLAGPSGGGKTYSAHLLAQGFQQVYGGDICCIDADNGRSEFYADEFKFKIIRIGAPYGAERYQRAVEAAVKQGAKTIIVDTFSHEHEGPGGVLEIHEEEQKRLMKEWRCNADTANWPAWREAKRYRKRFVEYIRTGLDANLLACFRATEKIRPATAEEKRDDPRARMIDMGWMPVAGAEYYYEMLAMAILPPNAEGYPEWHHESLDAQKLRKIPSFFKDILVPGNRLSREMGLAMAQWAQSGKPQSLPKSTAASSREDESTELLKKHLADIARIKNIGELDLVGGNIKADVEAGRITDAHRRQLRRAFDEREESFDEQP